MKQDGWKILDFDDFDNRFSGYVYIKDDIIYIPAVISKYPNKGNFKDLINKLKKEFKEVRFTAVIPPPYCRHT